MSNEDVIHPSILEAVGKAIEWASMPGQEGPYSTYSYAVKDNNGDVRRRFEVCNWTHEARRSQRLMGRLNADGSIDDRTSNGDWGKTMFRSYNADEADDHCKTLIRHYIARAAIEAAIKAAGMHDFELRGQRNFNPNNPEYRTTTSIIDIDLTKEANK